MSLKTEGGGLCLREPEGALPARSMLRTEGTGVIAAGSDISDA